MEQTCYRHPNRETRVSCSNCGRPICPDCMTPTPVGMRCPECARERTKVTRGAGEASLFARAPATFILIAANVAVFFAEIATGSGGFGEITSSLIPEFGLFGPSVASGEWYRLLTSAFLHASLFHIAGNMILLFFLGRILEPGIGTPRFVMLYFVSLFAGSFGALLLSPDSLSIGASGAVFGVLAATFVIARGRGVDALASSVGVLILLNLAFSLGVPGISIGAHLGGLAGGVICALFILGGERGMLGERHLPMELLAMAAIGFFSIAAAITVA
ncbi:MAG TPA: rhomboid family intramembrane serine protease [Solirubrobacterales bacterium]|nr:rhomboid family intramembrane serine protease [Solirubrobacterales bacterium]